MTRAGNPPTAVEVAYIIRRRKEGATQKTIAEELGLHPPQFRRLLIELHEQGRIEADIAFGYCGRPKSLKTVRREKTHRMGVPGLPLSDIFTHEEADRLGLEVRRGGFVGYNELLVELFRDWVAEKDARSKK